MKRRHNHTSCVHNDFQLPADLNSHTLPLYLTSSFDFDDAISSVQAFKSPYEQMVYTRYGNPTVRAVAQKIAHLESPDPDNPAFGLLCNSGMSAIATLLYSLISPGQTIITQADLYGGTSELLTKILSRWKVHTKTVDFSSLPEVEQALHSSDSPSIIYLETPTNPLLNCIDIQAVCQLANARSIPVIVDNTFATPLLQKPLALGAEYVIHSTTKYLNGHGNALGGAIITKSHEQLQHIWNIAKLHGSTASPMDAWLLNMGIKTLALRMKSHCTNASKVARHLQDHPQVTSVFYPGLESHRTHHIAAAQMADFGGMLSFELLGGYQKGLAFMDALDLCSITPTLGDVDTLVLHPASSSHKNINPAQRQKAGISDGLLRMSLGIEDSEDIIQDIDQAFAKIS